MSVIARLSKSYSIRKTICNQLSCTNANIMDTHKQKKDAKRDASTENQTNIAKVTGLRDTYMLKPMVP